MSFSGSLATKCVSLINEPCINKPTFSDFNTVELNYYQFIVSLNKCSGSCNTVDDLFTKTCGSNKTRDLNVKLFNMIATTNKPKILLKHVSVD